MEAVVVVTNEEGPTMVLLPRQPDGVETMVADGRFPKEARGTGWDIVIK